MERAKVAIFEDNESLIELAKMCLEGTDHEIVAIGRDRSESLDALDAMFYGNKRSANVFVVDGNLGRYREGRDGRDIIDGIRRHRLAGFIIGASEDTMPGVDKDPGKGVYEMLEEYLDRLPDQLPRRD